ncbi:DUF4870 domain-containing protein [Rhabdothermincola sediminis]|uniref:DUF4870 domain-containing protein n=1 Tax=Rhabdothermincola sediminis TaxID=2751370 RepID=UPI00355660F6
METAPEHPPPGWYPDPTGQLRWWDGQQWGQAAQPGPSPAPTPATGSGGDPKTLAMLSHLLAIFAGFLAPLVIYLVNGERDPFIRHHSAESLNFQITLFIAYVVCFVLMFVLIGFVLFFVVWIASLVFMIQATIAANRGEWYRYPINIRMVPGAIG